MGLLCHRTLYKGNFFILLKITLIFQKFYCIRVVYWSKRKKDNQTVSDVPLTEHQPPSKCTVEDESIVWISLRLLEDREDNEEDGTGVEPLTWNQFCKEMVDESKSPTIVGYGPVYPQPPTNAGVVQASMDYFMSQTV